MPNGSLCRQVIRNQATDCVKQAGQDFHYLHHLVVK